MCLATHLFISSSCPSSMMKSPRSPLGVPTHAVQHRVTCAYLRGHQISSWLPVARHIHTPALTNHANCNGAVTENVSYLPLGSISLHMLGPSSVNWSTFREDCLSTARSGQWKSSSVLSVKHTLIHPLLKAVKLPTPGTSVDSNTRVGVWRTSDDS